jgi:hypothetical protein
MKKIQITAQLLLADVRGLGIFPNKLVLHRVYTDALLAKDENNSYEKRDNVLTCGHNSIFSE